jgi:hypothetical protein
MSAATIARPDVVQRNTETDNPSQEDIANLAYHLWQQRGAPTGTAEQDWIEAENQLRNPSKGITYPARP